MSTTVPSLNALSNEKARAGSQSASAQSQIQMFGAWCGLAYLACLIIGWVFVAGFFPPQSPAANPGAVAAFFQVNLMRIRVGMIIVMFAALAVIPFTAVISQLTARIEGSAGVITYTILLGGMGTAVLTFYPAVWWLVAAYRPDRPADLIGLMNDQAWLQLLGGLSLFLAMPFGVTLAALTDRSPDPVFPRWSGFLNIWMMVLIIPDQLIFFFYSGPFAWSGLFGFYIPLASFAAWCFLVTFLVRNAILREHRLMA